MSVSSAKGMLARLKKLERTRGASADMVAWVRDTFTDALAQGRMCPMDGPVVMRCLLGWMTDGHARTGTAGEGLLS